MTLGLWSGQPRVAPESRPNLVDRWFQHAPRLQRELDAIKRFPSRNASTDRYRNMVSMADSSYMTTGWRQLFKPGL